MTSLSSSVDLHFLLSRGTLTLTKGTAPILVNPSVATVIHWAQVPFPGACRSKNML